MDQGLFKDAVEKFDRAIELAKAKYVQYSPLTQHLPYVTCRSPANPLPLVNKALALFQWKKDFSAAEELCREALVMDPSCEPAVATLAQLALQKSEIEVAIGWFEKQVDLARGEGEVVAALTYLEVRPILDGMLGC